MSVTRLYHAETVELDERRLERLASRMGQGAAERHIARTMEEIAVRLTRIESAFDQGAIDRVAKGARGLIRVATQTGLITLGNVAAQVASLTATTDSAALAASIARLIRVGEMSLVTVWDVQDISI